MQYRRVLSYLNPGKKNRTSRGLGSLEITSHRRAMAVLPTTNRREIIPPQRSLAIPAGVRIVRIPVCQRIIPALDAVVGLQLHLRLEGALLPPPGRVVVAVVRRGVHRGDEIDEEGEDVEGEDEGNGPL